MNTENSNNNAITSITDRIISRKIQNTNNLVIMEVDPSISPEDMQKLPVNGNIIMTVSSKYAHLADGLIGALTKMM